MKYKHILITRFNLPKKWNKDKTGDDVLTEVWIKDRYRLFENYCFPTIKNQSTKNYEWWVYFDEQMSDSFKERNLRFHEKYVNFIPKYEKSYDDFEYNMPIEISNYLRNKNIDWLITSRLDNDDLFAFDTIERIQAKAGFKENSILEIPYGYTIELVAPYKIKRVKSTLNPFISLVEKVKKDGKILTVYHKAHNKWDGINKIEVSDKPQWIQLIHDKNISNKSMGKYVFPKNITKKFKLKDKNLINKIFFKFLVYKIFKVNLTNLKCI